MDETCQVLCVLDSFYSCRHPAPVSVPIPHSIPERYKFCGHSSADLSSSNYCARFRGGNQDTHDQTQYLLQVGVYVLLLLILCFSFYLIKSSLSPGSEPQVGRAFDFICKNQNQKGFN